MHTFLQTRDVSDCNAVPVPTGALGFSQMRFRHERAAYMLRKSAHVFRSDSGPTFGP